MITGCTFLASDAPSDEEMKKYPALKESYDAYLITRKLCLGK
jgi:hypothetical protein